MRYVKDQRGKNGLLGDMISTGKDKEAEKLMAEAEKKENRKQQKGLQMLRRLKKT